MEVNSVSNDTGRALEYELTKQIVDLAANNKIKVTLTQRAIANNIRDKIYLESLSKAFQDDFSKYSKAFISWIIKNQWFSNAKTILIDRLPDSEGVESDVTDIRITIDGNTEKNISLKHNHNALKHPRISNLARQCGVTDINIAKKYKTDYKKIWNDFMVRGLKLKQNSTQFCELKDIDNDFIDVNLYKPLIELVVNFINNNLKNKNNLKHFFTFLTGKVYFIAVKNEGDYIIIKHFENLNAPASYKIVYPYENRLSTFFVEFDNGWKMTLRLHTASKEYIINNKVNSSVKLDVLCINLEDMIVVEKIKK